MWQEKPLTDFALYKRQAYGLLHNLARTGDVAAAYHETAVWTGCYPFETRTERSEIADVWAQLRRAIPDIERRDSIFVAGESQHDDRMGPELTGRPLVATLGTYQGVMRENLCGIPASHGVVTLRFCEVHHLTDGKISQSYILWDLLDLMHQVGCWPIAPSLGAEGMWQGPATSDGVLLDRHDPIQGQAGFDIVMAMHAALGAFDGVDLDSMNHAEYWTEDFLWYGPAGIGTTRGMEGFRAHHQIPFLIAFPDRRGSGHYVRISDGPFVVTGGWPSVQATHTGEWLGLGATGKHVDMRVMDFYRLDGSRIAENWVPIDIIWMLKQLGVDVFARLAHLQGSPRLTLPRR